MFGKLKFADNNVIGLVAAVCEDIMQQLFFLTIH